MMKNTICIFICSVFCTLIVASPLLYANGSSRVTPGNLYALTLSEGSIRMQITAEQYKEKNQIINQESPGEIVDTEFSEQIMSLELSIGMANNWELGIVVPFADATFEETDMDEMILFQEDDKGLGNVRLITKYGRQMPDNNFDMLAELAIGIPTDSRSDGTKAAGDAIASLNIERYWDKFSVNSKIAAVYRAEEEFSGGDVVELLQLGIGYSVTPKIYSSATAIHDDDINFLEVVASYRITDNSSIEISLTKDMDSEEDIEFYGITISQLF